MSFYTCRSSLFRLVPPYWKFWTNHWLLSLAPMYVPLQLQKLAHYSDYNAVPPCWKIWTTSFLWCVWEAGDQSPLPTDISDLKYGFTDTVASNYQRQVGTDLALNALMATSALRVRIVCLGYTSRHKDSQKLNCAWIYDKSLLFWIAPYVIYFKKILSFICLLYIFKMNKHKICIIVILRMVLHCAS